MGSGEQKARELGELGELLTARKDRSKAYHEQGFLSDLGGDEVDAIPQTIDPAALRYVCELSSHPTSVLTNFVKLEERRYRRGRRK